MRDLKKLAPLAIALVSVTAHAIPVIPDNDGWSGHINLGAGVGSSESNMLDGIRLGGSWQRQNLQSR